MISFRNTGVIVGKQKIITKVDALLNINSFETNNQQQRI